MGLFDTLSIPRRQCHLLFLIGVSESMAGSKIGSINDAIENVLPMIGEISDQNPDAAIYCNIMYFNDNCKWLYDSPTLISDFVYSIESLGKGNSLGECYKSLNRYLDRIQNEVSYDALFAPIIVMLVDRNPSDEFSCKLQNLRNNNLFNSAIKIAIQIGEEMDPNVLTEFTGSWSTVINVHSIESLKKLIRLQPLSQASFEGKKSDAFNNILRNAIDYAIKEFGKKVVTEERFISILCDYHGFDSVLPAKTILRNAVRLGYMEKLFRCYSDNLKIASLYHDFIQITGFERELVNFVFNQITEVLKSHGETGNIAYSYKHKQVPIVFIVDSSDNISGSKIDFVNDVIGKLISLFSQIDERDPFAQGYIASIAYGDSACWINNIPAKTADYVWKGVNGKGMSQVSDAFTLLKKDFKILFERKHFDPILILISASKSVDNYEPIINELSDYYEYEYAIRIGIAIGEDADYKLLKKFASSEDTIVSEHNIESLNKLVSYRYSFPELPISDEPTKSFFI